MSWSTATEDLQGCSVYEIVQAVVELMFAVNEREQLAGAPITEWLLKPKSPSYAYAPPSPTFFDYVTFPTITDFDGLPLNATIGYRTILDGGIQTGSLFRAIYDLMLSHGYVDSEGKQYDDIAELCSEIGDSVAVPFSLIRNMPTDADDYGKYSTDRIESTTLFNINRAHSDIVIDSISFSSGEHVVVGSGFLASNHVYVGGVEITDIIEKTDTIIRFNVDDLSSDGIFMDTDPIVSFDVFCGSRKTAAIEPPFLRFSDKPIITYYSRNVIQPEYLKSIAIDGYRLGGTELGAPTVTVGGVACTINQHSYTRVVCTVPELTGGLHDIVLATSEGVATITDAIHYVTEDSPLEPFAITDISPPYLRYGVAGQFIKITGTGLYSFIKAPVMSINGVGLRTLFVRPHEMVVSAVDLQVTGEYVPDYSDPYMCAGPGLVGGEITNYVRHMLDVTKIIKLRNILDNFTRRVIAVTPSDMESVFHAAQGPEIAGTSPPYYEYNMQWPDSADMWAGLWAEAIESTGTEFDPETGTPKPLPTTHDYALGQLRWLLTIQYLRYQLFGQWAISGWPWCSIIGPKLHYQIDLSALPEAAIVERAWVTYNAGWIAEHPYAGWPENTPINDISCYDSFGNEIVIDKNTEGLLDNTIEIVGPDLSCGESNACWFSLGDPDGFPETLPFSIVENDYNQDCRASIMVSGDIRLVVNYAGALTYG